MAYFISDTVSGDTLKAEIFQGLFYHNSIFKSIIRRNRSSSDTCKCTTYPGYVAGRSSFHCNEDILVKKSHLIAYLQDSSAAVERYDIGYLFDFLNSHEGDSIAISAVFDKMYEESGGTKAAPIYIPFPCPWMSGTACGCCGNYNGACLMCAAICLMHDYVCWQAG